MSDQNSLRKLTLGSLFDGSGGFPLGGLLCGIEPIWASEIEPFPIRVTTKRIPSMKHYGDITELNGAELPPADIITFGSPCTDMSVAGKRAGLDGSQSVLFYEAIRIIKEMRCKTNGRYPRYAVWENVPGAFSSNNGDDFGAVLDAFVGIVEPIAKVSAPQNGRWPYADILLGDGWSLAYRTIDAQYFGVAQRRRRIYLVADFTGGSAGDILFEREGMSRDFTPRGCPWKRTAGNAESGSGESGKGHSDNESVMSFEPGAASRVGGHVDDNISGSLRANMGDNQTAVAIENHPADGRCKVSDTGKVQTLLSRMGTGGMNVPLVMNSPKTLKIRTGCLGGGKGALIQDDISATLSRGNDQTVFVPTAYGICSDGSNSMRSDNPRSGIYEAETSRTIDVNGGNPGCNQGGIAILEPVVFTQNQRDEVRNLNDKSGAIAAEPGIHQQTYVLQGSMIGREDKNGPRGSGIGEEVSFTLDTNDRHAVAYAMTTGEFRQTCREKSPCLQARDYKDPPVVSRPSYIVRRLTPTECARLQGFPDWWCDDLGTENPTEEEISFWADVWETHRRIKGTSSKPKTRSQIAKWLNNPHSDSAEYAMWGNGVALPCVCFVLMGIVLSTQENAH